jgi:hypothetical protein
MKRLLGQALGTPGLAGPDANSAMSTFLLMEGDSGPVVLFPKETGEGIEKKEENFAEEVAKQMGM